MSDYDIKYQHIERWDTDETQYLKDCQELIVQPKLDGTNGVVAYNPEDDSLIIGSRNRYITVDNDNQGFAKYIMDNKEKYLRYFREHPCNVLYGEFMINHVFRVKPEFARQFYVFDVYSKCINKYIPMIEDDLAVCGIKYVPSMYVEPTNLLETLKGFDSSFGRFLLDDSLDHGEGYVIKNFYAHNQYGRQVWAKVLNESLKKTRDDLFGDIRAKFFTDAWIEKETIKYNELFEGEPFNETKYINILIREFIKEEIANIVFKFKFPKISFQNLKAYLTGILKEHLNG